MPENVESVTEDILKETRNICISAQSLIKRLCGKFDEFPRELIELCENIIYNQKYKIIINSISRIEVNLKK
ncbi:hypothetical protein [Candidatus Endomicrobiellum agilis]|jgi:hypothetical protein|uniref:hypothetical protein n=1 Tax=Candidatus Endomicrobiellum agilis TaxID=3238957 RepID=UPI00358B0175|nr:hypothetical protein [Endomicrobium sp.]